MNLRPPMVRHAGLLVAIEAVAALVMAVVLAALASTGTDKHAEGFNAYGTAGWFAIMGVGLLAGGWALITGRRWGRGIGVFANLLLLGVAWYMCTSHQMIYGILVGVLAVLTIGMLFSPSAVRWAASHD